MRKFIAVLISIFCQQILWAQTELSPTAWGDLGDGTYANPVLLSDYSDPDIIRVGKKYYMICSEFHFMGMPVLESDDMV
ncbi:MAG: family 43 glycosylhydrolase, partial [Bacteroidaceae bacterium]|nr:family 43 glycosylhydrolase [Bacteroidaceae bacterium]